jgi:hypothetical protein
MHILEVNVMITVQDAFDDFRADRLTDPMLRYNTTERDVFAAGWKAAGQKKPNVKENVWFSAPVAPEDDPE